MENRCESNPKENHWRKHRQFSSNALFDAKAGIEQFGRRVKKRQISFHAELGSEGTRTLAAEFVFLDSGHADAGWKPLPEVLNKTCANS